MSMAAREQPAFGNTVIRASAGTGKTFQLSNRFLALAASGARPDHILAATFARKAAAEIKDRILVRLATAAQNEKDRAELEEFLGCGRLDHERCLQLLRNLVRNLHRLSIGTLDSFLAQLMGSYSLELGLTPGSRIVDEQTAQRLKSQAIRDVVASHSTEELVTLMHLLSKGEIRRSVTEQIHDVVDSLYADFREAPAEAWNVLQAPPRLTADQLELALAELRSLKNLPGKRLESARDSLLDQVLAEDWDGVLSKGVSGKVAVGETQFYRKELPPELVAACRPLVQQAVAVLIGRIVDQTRGTYQLLKQYDETLQLLKQRGRALRFDDITALVANGFASRILEDVGFRLDAGVEHLLLDEFQDTSLPQWDAIRHFAENTSSTAGHSFFCVGDVKQAIYGWRGGVSELFDTVTSTLPEIDVKHLDRSFRSSQAVMETVNQVFDNPPKNDVIAEFPQAAMAWRERFNPHQTELEDLSGYCRMITAPLAEEKSRQRAVTLHFAAAQAARWHFAFPDRSLGILVRRNATVGQLIFLLQSEYGIRASEEGGNPLTDSVAVLKVLELLRLADHPANTTSRFCVATSPLGEALGYLDYADDRAAEQLSRKLRRELMARGYAATIYSWTRLLAPSCNRRELGRLLQLCRLATSYEPLATERPADFIEYVQLTKVEDPASEKVRVMTVHQSKGLEFDMVLLPELEGTISGRTPSVMLERPSPSEPVQGICRYIKQDLLKLLPERFRLMQEAHQARQVNESLCVLYVALTRAVHVLDMIIPPAQPAEKKIPNTLAGALRCSLAKEASAGPEEVLFEYGAASWQEKMAAVDLEQKRKQAAAQQSPAGGDPLAEIPADDGAADASGEPAVGIPLVRAASATAARGLGRIVPSSLEGGAKVRLLDELQLQPQTAALRGSLHHQWYEQIRWLDEEIPADEALLPALQVLGLSAFEPAAEIAAFRETLERPDVADLLTRARYLSEGLAPYPETLRTVLQAAGTTVEVFAEKPFAVRLGNDLLEGIIDRLVLFVRDGRVIAADVIDFKTDQVDLERASQYAERVAHYQPQINAYRQAVCTMYRLPHTAVPGRLLFVRSGTSALFTGDPAGAVAASL